MTANRWWVRAAARWLARYKTTEGQLRSLSLGVTAFSTFSLVLQNAGLGQFVPYVGVVGAIGWTGYSYLYSEGGVHNQTQRDMADLADNYSGPTMLMDAKITGRQLSRLAYLLQNGEADSVEDIEREMDDVTRAEWTNLRNGINVEEIES